MLTISSHYENYSKLQLKYYSSDFTTVINEEMFLYIYRRICVHIHTQHK